VGRAEAVVTMGTMAAVEEEAAITRLDSTSQPTTI